MKLPQTFEGQIQLAGLLILIGLAVELVTIFWVHPFSFMVFTMLGLSLTLAGMVLYGWAAAHRT